MEDNEDYIALYNRLQSFYILITIHDIQQYNPEELGGLAHRLEGELSLNPHQQAIHQELTAKSNTNVAEKKRKKKEKKQALLQPPPEPELYKQQQFTAVYLAEPDHTINQTMILEDIHKEDWKITDSFSGVIYDGKLLIKLRASLDGSTEQHLLPFEVCSQQKESSVTRSSLERLKQGKPTPDLVWLFIQTKKQSFTVVEEGNNILGLDFLKNNNVLLQCNFRADSFNFQLKYTL